MRNITVLVNGVAIEIFCEYDHTYNICLPYKTNQSAKYTVSVTEDDLKYVEQFFKGYTKEHLEEVAIQDKANQILLDIDMVMFHSAAVMVDNEAYLLAAVSNGGKTTQVLRWLEYFGDKAQIINGDYPLISFDDKNAYASGTPWCGKENLSNKKTVKIAGVCFIEKSDYIDIKKLSSKEIIDKIFLQMIMPKYDFEIMQKYFALANKLINIVPFYNLKCDISEQAVKTAYEYMKVNNDAI